MSNQADIRDIQALGDLKAAFGRFGDELQQILPALQKQFEEIQGQLDDRQKHWRQQSNDAKETLYAARQSLNECESQGEDEDGNSPDCSFEQDGVTDAEKALAENEDNLETVKQWRHRIESQIADFQNDVHRLSNLASSRTSSAQAFLANKIEILNRYIGNISSVTAMSGLPAQGRNDKMDTETSEASPIDKMGWHQNIRKLLQEYQAAPDHKLADLRERARVELEIPKSDRNKLNMTFLSSDANINSIARQGAEIIERFVSPDLVKNTTVKIQLTELSRSFHRKGEVHLSREVSERVAAHEIMHAVEQQNPQVLKAATEFLFMRGHGEVPVSLSRVTGLNYKPHEKTFEDKWVEKNGAVYAGKIYSEYEIPAKPSHLRATEVLTMGIERLDADPLEFCKNDPQWFNFTINTLRNL